MSTENTSLSLNIAATSMEMATTVSDPTLSPSSDDVISYAVFYGYYYSILILLTVVNIAGNSLVVAAVMKFRALRSNVNSYFIASLACSDILCGTFYCLYQLGHMHTSVISQMGSSWVACQVIFSILNAGFLCSSYNLVTITVIRYIAVSDPLKFMGRVTKRRAIVTIATIWLLSVVVSFSINIKRQPDTYTGICLYEKFQSVWHLVVILVSYTMIPWILMIILYTRIVVLVRYRLRTNAAKQNQVQPSDQPRPESKVDPHILKKELKMTKTVAFVLGYFIFAWIPLMTYLFVSLSCKTCNINHNVRGTVRLLLQTNSCVNVFIYAGTNQEFKKALRALVCRFCNRRNSQIDQDASLNTLATNACPSV
ncbi:adenosine receptor A1-like [Ptychodera flava]|uniref:adenosine receptor A1-like n=1 Tax=Ptychodera flava TaxID=63121 RepID=UPI00396A8795